MICLKATKTYPEGRTGTYAGNDLVLNGHRAQDCPERIDVQTVTDTDPVYVHGDCQHLKGGIEHDD